MDSIPEVAILYIDNSNIFINAQKHSAKLKKYMENIQDVCCRVDIGKLLRLACDGKQLLCGKLYGSEPPALDTVWKAIRKKEIEVHTSKKNCASKEKETDTSLTADAVEDLVLYSPENKDKLKTFILFSGDRDMLPVIQKAQKYGWNVHVWAFENTLATEIRRECRLNKCVNTFHVDDVFDKITFCETEWGNPIPRERSLVLEFSDHPGNRKRPEKDQFMKAVIDLSSKIFSLPTRGLFLSDQLFVVVICVEEKYVTMKGTTSYYDFTHNVWSKAKELKTGLKNCSDCQTYVKYRQNMNPNNSELFWDDHNPDDDQLEINLPPEDYFDLNFQCVKRKTKKQHTKYSAPCEYRFWCRKGHQCPYSHSPHEEEYFKKNQNINPLQRYKYKSRICTRNQCTHRDKTYLCPFAHDVKEARCLRCLGTGLHWTDECPLI